MVCNLCFKAFFFLKKSFLLKHYLYIHMGPGNLLKDDHYAITFTLFCVPQAYAKTLVLLNWNLENTILHTCVHTKQLLLINFLPYVMSIPRETGSKYPLLNYCKKNRWVFSEGMVLWALSACGRNHTDILLPAFPEHVVPTSQGFILMGTTAKTVENRPIVHACVGQKHRNVGK